MGWRAMAPAITLAGMPDDFTDKIALVTGSSRGIGAGIIQAFGARGARCVVNFVADPDGKNQADAEKIAGSLKNAVLIEGDVSDEGQVRAMMDRIARAYG